ncbi:excalibur calcium-binding domain-containing protein [Streptomyces diastatochromogenes]|nr:excalibur calcium-binding domain-containing protein [Streptomyces diastatochromogenes]
MAVKSRPARSRVIGRGALVLAVVAVALVVVVLVRGGWDSEAQAQNSDPEWCTPGTPRTALCPNSKVFDAKEYATHGNAFGCVDFASQADAQAVLRADPGDPNRLDDGGGVACRGLPEPRDTKPVSRARQFTCGPGDPRSALCPQPNRAFDARYFLRFGNDAYDCSDFARQADAQAVLRFEPADPNRLDDDGNGIACPDLPGPKDNKPVRR